MISNDEKVQKFMANPNRDESMKEFLAIMRGYHQETSDTLDKINANVSNLVNRIEAVEGELAEIKARMVETDPCEIRFKGIPCTSVDNHKNIISSLLTTINCPDALVHVIQIREWIITSHDNASSSKVPIPTLVAKFSSPTVRDLVMSHNGGLRGKTFLEIFKYGPDTPIFMDSLAGRTRDNLAYNARLLAKSKGIPNPRTRGNALLMRRSPNEPEVTILTNRDLQKFDESCPPLASLCTKYAQNFSSPQPRLSPTPNSFAKPPRQTSVSRSFPLINNPQTPILNAHQLNTTSKRANSSKNRKRQSTSTITRHVNPKLLQIPTWGQKTTTSLLKSYDTPLFSSDPNPPNRPTNHAPTHKQSHDVIGGDGAAAKIAVAPLSLLVTSDS